MIMNKLIILLFTPCLCSAGEFLGMKDVGNMSYLNARYLSHATARFISQDPKKQFKSQYVYGNGSVVKWSDPDGEMFRVDMSGPYEKMDEDSRAWSFTKEAVNKLVVKPAEKVASGVGKGVNKVIETISPPNRERRIRSRGSLSSGMYRENKQYAHNLLSMRDTIESKVRYEMKHNGNNDGLSSSKFEDRVKINVSYGMDDYVRIRNKNHAGKASRGEKSVLNRYHHDLNRQPEQIREAITQIGHVNKVTYNEMLQELIQLYSEGPWRED